MRSSLEPLEVECESQRLTATDRPALGLLVRITEDLMMSTHAASFRPVQRRAYCGAARTAGLHSVVREARAFTQTFFRRD